MVRPLISGNSQAISIVERVHQTIGSILRSFKVQYMILDDRNSWDGILVSIMFALRSTVHTTMLYTPAQLVFGRDSIINQRHDIY